MAQRIRAAVRLKRDYMKLKEEPIPYILVEPTPANFLEWRYVIRGPEGTPYEGGHYQGKIVFPNEFPFKPPTIYMLTPNGKFKINEPLCMNLNDFPDDEWNPTWAVSSVLLGLLSIMTDDAPTIGTIETTEVKKKQLAAMSRRYNLLDKTFCELFSDLAATVRREIEAGPPIGSTAEVKQEEKKKEPEPEEEPFYRLRATPQPKRERERSADEDSDESCDDEQHLFMAGVQERIHEAMRRRLVVLRRRNDRIQAIRKRRRANRRRKW